MSLKIPLQLTNQTDIARTREPVTWGVPVARSEIFNIDKLIVEDSSGNYLPANFESTALWPDGSIKWFLVDFQIDLDPNETTQLFIHKKQSHDENRPSNTDEKIIVNECDDKLIVDTGSAVFTVNKHRLTPLSQVKVNGCDQLISNASTIRLIDNNGYEARPIITSTQCLNPENSLKRDFILSGNFFGQKDELLAEFSLVLNFFAGKSTVKYDFTILNPHAAIHNRNLWDLGDPGSLFFKDLSVDVELNLPETGTEIIIKEMNSGDTLAFQSDQLLIYQDSSGGDNWSSKNHVNHLGRVPVKFKGYKIIEAGALVGEGDRAQPILQLKLADQMVSAHICHFWQNFPKALEFDNQTLSLKLFPQHFSDVFELQGGEQKTHSFYLDFSSENKNLDWVTSPIRVVPSLEYFSKSKTVYWLPKKYENTAIQRLVNRGIEGNNNFFEKRETIDEYGWRNFGEIYADHEILEYKGSEPLVSHYNNQYDALYGMVRQYIVTGDSKWFELASDLAQHIIDIDIYHTSKDRDEYNGGLFWHTDHYLNAYTATHRTFSLPQFDDEMSYKSGGGPGAEHCYTTGLAYFYFLTGNPVYKTAALQLAGWLTFTMEGSGTILERIYNFKNKDIPIIKKLASGAKVLDNKYPFTRATGNYITALIDAYSLTGNNSYVVRIENVIRQTIHPKENIDLRNLDDKERSWSYLIFLQSLTKYLQLKEGFDCIDENYFYTLNSFFHFTDWMVDNEAPILETPEILDYPNHTWVAQDLRKANILYIAASYNNQNKHGYLEKADYFFNYVSSELEKEDTRYFSRILIILMQNDMHPSYLSNSEKWKQHQYTEMLRKPAVKTIHKIIFNFFKDIFFGILKISLSKEIKWLKYRLKA